ncbi:hypothetical protein DV735_g3609, partial [Chaetothyriales sp. CBS 134920]
MHTAALLVSNVHCPSCVSYIQSILGSVPGVQGPPDVSLIEHTVRVHFDASLTSSKRISDSLLNAGFEVKHVSELDSNQHEIKSVPVDEPPVSPKPASWSRARSKAMQHHIDNCTACQREKGRTPSKWKSWAARTGLVHKTTPQTPPKQVSESSQSSVGRVSGADEGPAVINIDGTKPDESRPATYLATIAIGGMTCSACTNTVTQAVSSLDNVISVDVNLVSHSAKVVYSGTEKDVTTIVTTIDDVGYDASLVSVDLQNDSGHERYRMKINITGMTCGSCVGAITRGLEELPSIRSVSIDLVGNSGVIEYEGKDTSSAIIEKIEELGYDAEVSSIALLEASARPTSERTVQIKVDGMYCQHCPQKILSGLEKLYESGVEKSRFRILGEPTLDDPVVTVVYRPSIEDDITIRRFISSIEAADPALTASVYQPPSLEERSRQLQLRERNLILARLIFTAIVAIPSFIIGVVFMSLVPATNHIRQWLEEPIWAGMAMRMDWALFIITTPVMLFGSDLFHRRALKEIRAMWGPKSRVPLLRRFYRFGSMNLLISAGTSVAYFASLAVLILAATDNSHTSMMARSSDTYFDTVVFLTLFLLIGKYLEAYSKAKTGNAVAMLSSLRPTEARLVLKNHETKVIPVNQLEVGDVVQLAHGQSPPADSVIEQQGVFLFDESSLTGESMPVKKGRGDEVFTGSVNTSDAVRIAIKELGGSSMLDRIIDVVREGQSKRAPIERFADVITGYFTPIITLIAIVTWIIWLSLGVSGAIPSAWLDVRQGGWAFWSLEFAIAVFVVACPCGIGLAAPTALFVGGGLAAKNSILVQGGGEAFQEASRLKTLVFDKTGTLTQGQMKVTELETFSQVWKTDMIKAAAKALEDASSHPIAKAISEFCADGSNNSSIEHDEFRELPGMGMAGTFTIDNRRVEVAIGNERLLSQLSAPVQSEKWPVVTTSTMISTNDLVSQRIQHHQSLAHSTAIFAVRHRDSEHQTGQFQPIALFAISDPLRPEADSVISSLRESGVEVHMCTGDNATTARAIAGQLGIPVANVRAGVLPQDKAAYIAELQHGGSGGRRVVVGFVGDGTNDTPALSTADVSIALSSGSDIAITSSSFILLNPTLHSIPVLIRLSKRVFRRVKLNFAWAAVYNVVLVPVAAGVLSQVGNGHGGIWRLSPVWASVAMAGSSVSVVLSSLALRLPEVRWC